MNALTDMSVRIVNTCNDSVYHNGSLFASRTALISALISSKDSSGLFCASFRMSRMAFIAFSRILSSVSAVMVKGMLRLRTTVRTNMLMAVLALMPNCSQSWSNFAVLSPNGRSLMSVP